MRAMRSALTVSAVGLMLAGPRALAQNGVSDDRVSLPDGPGSIGGVGENVDINPNMGSSSYQVPFRVPPGASEGTTPGLALVYASGQGMGVAGIGWDMSLPTIERMVQKGLPTYTTADHFTADGGNELSYVGDLDGTRVYRQRFEGGFVRYRWWNAGAGTAGYWTAEGPDGTTVYFGADADGQTVASARVQATDGKTFRYHAVEVRDTVGRRMVYTYTKQDGWPLVDEVRYGFGALTTPRFSVRMGYEARTDVVSNATPGYEIRLARRLATVQVLSDATVIRRYQLVYESDAQSGGMTRLARVSELGRDGGKLPIEQSFTYSRTLTGSCVVGCEKPFMVDMGTLPGGVDIQTGRASLIDINGDSLPDVLESDTSGVHKFHLSQLSAEGRPTFSSTVVTSAKTVGGSSFVLSSPGVQLLDVNGDGFTDIVDQVNGKVLCNTGSGDWSGTDCIQHPGDLPTLADDPSDPGSTSDPLGMRFFDYDNDKRIDLLRTPDATSASVSRNTGTGYASVTIDPIGAAFDAENLQLDDINGDGLQDPVMLVSSGSGASLQFKLNLGFGHWQPSWTTLTIDGLGAAEVDGAVLQDLDGDGLSDIVVVSGTTVSYWRNRNAGRFDARQDLVSADIDGQIPERTDAETVVFADMNGNGTDDVVWIGSGGHVRFLELFPVRPNLLSRVENGIGWVRVIEYGTSIAQRARDAGTAGAWTTPLPESMNIVTATDTWVTLTGGEDGAGVHERRELAYHDGFYDGVEKSFRGFEKVEQSLVTDADDLQDPRLEVMEFDVGRDDPAHHGLLLRASVFGGAAADTPMQETTTEWGDCAVDGVASADPAVQFVCERATTVLHQEGASVSEWRRVRTEKTYDGYGNVTELRELGVVSSGADDAPTGCGPCASLPTGLSSGACGAQCLGDERITKTTFVVPGVDTGGAWLVHLPVKLTVQGSDGGALVSEESAFYDGPDFVGLAAGKATKGLVTRVSTRVSQSEVIDSARSAYTAQGELAASLDPLGKVSDATAHRRDYSYDERGLRPTRVTIHAGDHDLVKDVSYDASWYEASEATAYRVVKDGSDVTPRNSTSVTYDEFGRPIAIVRPGDTREAPSQTFTYELGDPVTRIVGLARKTPGGAMDVETVDCLDGRARSVQSLVKIDATHFQTDGFRELNSAGRVTRSFQPYSVSSDACPTAPPSAVPFETTRYDALGRDVETLAPDASIYGSASSARTQYGPLSVTLFDQNDTDADSAFVGTPTLRVSDGLDRLVRIERRLAKDGAPDVFTLAYDELGRVARVTDPAGHVKTQELDLLDRVVHSVDPNAGETHMTYDAAGNLVTQTDARGVSVAAEYDAVNRLVARFDPSDREGTLETLVYDVLADCADCRNGASELVAATYPLPGGATGSDRMGYDPRGRKALLRRTLEGHTFDTSYAYDGQNRLVSATYPDGQVVTYARDAAERVTGVTGVVSSVTYTNAGRIGSIVHANGVSDAFAYDALLRHAGSTSTGPNGKLLDTVVSRDRKGNIAAETDAITAVGRSRGSASLGGGHPSRAAEYSYDAYDRVVGALLGASGDTETLSYAYDASDNLTARTSSRSSSPANAGAFTYGGGDAGPNAVTQVGGVSYGYDAAGHLATRGDLSLVWDHEGRLVETASTTRAPSESGYSPDDERVLKTEDGGVAYYAAPDFVVRDGIASLYVKVGDRRVARLRTDVLAKSLLPDGNSDQHIDIADAWLARSGAAETQTRLLRAAARHLLFVAQGPTAHLHEDVRGSIVASSDGSGALIAERSFFPHGAERASTGWVDELGFTGQELDESSGLLHFQKRSLDLGSGRWASVDPKFAVLDASLVQRLGEATTGYAYVANNLASAVDPDGQVLFTLLTPLRKKVLPNRDRRKGKDGGSGGWDRAADAGGGEGRADADKKPTKPKSPRQVEREKRVEAIKARQKEVNKALRDIEENRQGEPGISKERRKLKAEKHRLETTRSSLEAPPSQIRYLLPDIVLVAGVVGGAMVGVMKATGSGPFADGDDSGDGDGGDGGDGGGGTGLFGGN